MRLDWDMMVRVHRGELTPAEAFAAQAARASAALAKRAGPFTWGPPPRPPEAPADPPEPTGPQEASATPTPAEGKPPGPDLCVYIPYSTTGNLGEAYNRVMRRLAPGDWACFLDHDALILTNDFWLDLRHAMARRPAAGAICCWSNRDGNPRQKAKGPQGDDIVEHTAYAVALRAEQGQRTTDVTAPQLSGVLFAVSRAAWEKAGPFAAGFGEVDNSWARQCIAAGLRMWRMDGVYIYHQRRTNGWKGATRPEIGCKGVSWQYATVAPIIAAHGDETLRELAAAHGRLVETRTDWGDCQKSARRKTLLAAWRGSLRLSVVIPSREEPPEELAGTVASFRAGGAHEIIVVDDGSQEHRVAADCGADIVIRHDTPQGVAPSRNAGLARTTGNVVAFSDSHCRIADGANLLDWAYAAYCSEDMLCAATASYEHPDRYYWGAALRWNGWRYDLSANLAETSAPEGVYGSVYCAARWTWDRLGGWLPTVGYGYNEQALSLLCRHCGVPIRILPMFRIRHKFRKQFPYSTSGIDAAANPPWTHWLLDTPPDWEARRAQIAAANPQALARAEERMAAHGAAELRAAYQARHRAAAPADIATRLARKPSWPNASAAAWAETIGPALEVKP